MFSAALLSRAGALIDVCRERRVRLATAESCTGGLLAGLLTEISGAGEVLDRGLVTYSNLSKTELLGVPEQVLALQGAVSAVTAVAMASGALARSKADFAVAITGIAGPTGGTPDKPVGLVHFAVLGRNDRSKVVERRFGAIGRRGIRIAAVQEGLALFESSVRGELG